jgi:hypothetical protein
LQLTEALPFELALDRWTRAVNTMAGLRLPELDPGGEGQGVR